MPLDQLAVQGGPWGIIALVVVSLIRGWLIPRRTHLDRIEDFKATIEALKATVHEQDKQLGILMGRAREPAP